MPGKSTTCSSGKSGSTRAVESVMCRAEKVEHRGSQHLYPDVQSALVEVERWAVMWAVQTTLGIGCANREIAAGHGVEKQSHVVSAHRAHAALDALWSN